MAQKISVVSFNETAPKRKRVAAYARVSSGKDAMLHSLSSQVSYYNKMIQSHPEWEFCGVYADEALTGTKDDRKNFQRLLSDCKNGKIDMVITKSISRFARNTLTLLRTVRELKTMGVSVFFEEQNIDTSSADGELMLTVLASYAQEESLSASENQKWRVRRNFENGIPCNPKIFGYKLVGDKYEVIPEEAEIIRFIFSEYISGKGYEKITESLKEKKMKSKFVYDWSPSVVSAILSNYTYTGNLLLQKTYRENHLTKKTLTNGGELPRYHVENSHQPIIDIKTFEAVQKEKAKRAEHFNPPGSKKTSYPFSSIITCENCGKHYRRKNTARGAVWICSTYNSKGKKYCASKQIPENTLFAVCGEVGGIGKITEIRACDDNTLVFTLFDGKTTVKRWKDRSRAESWTNEMKQAAREKAIERVKNI